MDFKSLRASVSIDNNDNDKIILPESILDLLITIDIEFPLTFEIISRDYKTYCGVLEFTSHEGTCSIPSCIMKKLHINEGDFVYIRYLRPQLGIVS